MICSPSSFLRRRALRARKRRAIEQAVESEAAQASSRTGGQQLFTRLRSSLCLAHDVGLQAFLGLLQYGMDDSYTALLCSRAVPCRPCRPHPARELLLRVLELFVLANVFQHLTNGVTGSLAAHLQFREQLR